MMVAIGALIMGIILLSHISPQTVQYFASRPVASVVGYIVGEGLTDAAAIKAEHSTTETTTETETETETDQTEQ